MRCICTVIYLFMRRYKMKNKAKKITAKILTFALVVSTMGIQSINANAAKKITLSKKSITIKVGDTKKIIIKNVKAKKVKKVVDKGK